MNRSDYVIERGVLVPVPGRAIKTTRVKPAPKVTFEEALQWLRRGHPIRRRSWHPGSSIFALKQDVFVQLPGREPNMDTEGTNYRRAPDIWRPYPSDFLADDWMKA